MNSSKSVVTPDTTVAHDMRDVDATGPVNTRERSRQAAQRELRRCERREVSAAAKAGGRADEYRTSAARCHGSKTHLRRHHRGETPGAPDLLEFRRFQLRKRPNMEMCRIKIKSSSGAGPASISLTIVAMPRSSQPSPRTGVKPGAAARIAAASSPSGSSERPSPQTNRRGRARDTVTCPGEHPPRRRARLFRPSPVLHQITPRMEKPITMHAAHPAAKATVRSSGSPIA